MPHKLCYKFATFSIGKCILYASSYNYSCHVHIHIPLEVKYTFILSYVILCYIRNMSML